MSISRNEQLLAQALRAANLNPLLHGERPEARGSRVERRSPVDGRELPPFHSSDAETVDQAVRSAQSTFESPAWGRMDPASRKAILSRLAGLIEKHAPELAVLDSISMGKPVRDCLEGDILKASECFRWFGEAIDKHYDLGLPPEPGVLATITREPLGVVAAISAWNYPAENFAWKVAPALAAGNCVVLKPAEACTLSALRLAELALEAGLPPGALNVVPGAGEETGAALARHPLVRGVFFTGSSATGQKILGYAGESSVRRVALECGGKGAFVVLAGCRHLPEAARALATGLFKNQGQTCSAPSRLIVEESIHDRFVELVLEEAKAWVPSHPLHPETRLGAVVSERSLAAILASVQESQKAGARLALGGRRENPVDGGAYLGPTVLTGVKSNMRVAQEEIFGPVLSVLRARNSAEAVAIANDSVYGLSAGVWTDDLDTALSVSRSLRSGTVHVNSFGEDGITAPFGGFGQSGNGFKEKSLLALDAYSNRKTTWIRVRNS